MCPRAEFTPGALEDTRFMAEAQPLKLDGVITAIQVRCGESTDPLVDRIVLPADFADMIRPQTHAC